MAIVFILLTYWAFKCYIMSPLYINNSLILSHIILHLVFICSYSLTKAVALLYTPCLKLNCSCIDIVYSYSENKPYVKQVLKAGSTLLCPVVVLGSQMSWVLSFALYSPSTPLTLSIPYLDLLRHLNFSLPFQFRTYPTHTLLVFPEQLCSRRSDTLQDVVHIYANRKRVWNNLCHRAGRLGSHLQT